MMKPLSFKRHRFPPDVIRHAIWLYFRFSLSLRDVEEMLARRGIEVSYETIRCWTIKFGPFIARRLRKRRPAPSANLTDAGLKANREVSVVLRRDRDPGFDDLPGLFDLLWDHADTLTVDIVERFAKVRRTFSYPDENDFERALAGQVDPVEPPSVRSATGTRSHRRSFLQTFRRKYGERLHPAFSEVRGVLEASGQRRPEFAHGDLNVEVSRFLGWLRIVHAPGESWHETPLLAGSERLSRIEHFRRIWADTTDITNGDMIVANQEIANVQRIRDAFASDDALRSICYDELFDTLLGCHAFLEQLRFTSGGLSGLREDFMSRNRLADVQHTLSHLALGEGDPLERAYDCLYDPQLSLSRFGEACIMELLGWVAPGYPPVNGRTIKALRFLGFDPDPTSSHRPGA